MGGIIFKDGQAICPNKLQAVIDWSPPKTKSDVKSFLGSVNFLRRFCKDLSHIAYPLTRITSDKVPFVWSTEEDNAFNSIKRTLMSAPILAHPDPSKPFVVESDASNFAIGAVLLQTQDDGLEHPVAFFSCKMILAEYPKNN